MLCYVMLYNVMLCNVMMCFDMIWYDMICNGSDWIGLDCVSKYFKKILKDNKIKFKFFCDFTFLICFYISCIILFFLYVITGGRTQRVN